MPLASQRDRTLERLRAAAGNWVPVPELARLAWQYSARILELRRLGHEIETQKLMRRRKWAMPDMPVAPCLETAPSLVAA